MYRLDTRGSRGDRGPTERLLELWDLRELASCSREERAGGERWYCRDVDVETEKEAKRPSRRADERRHADKIQCRGTAGKNHAHPAPTQSRDRMQSLNL